MTRNREWRSSIAQRKRFATSNNLMPFREIRDELARRGMPRLSVAGIQQICAKAEQKILMALTGRDNRGQG